MCGFNGIYQSFIGECESNTNKRMCKCNIGYNGKFCTKLTCNGTNWCKNGFKII